MATLEDLRNEILAWVPPMPILLAEKEVQRAWDYIRMRRQWGFLMADGQLFTPAQITTGTFSVTQFSSTIQADATAITALAGLTNPVITLRQIRFSGGPLYEISSYVDGTGVMTLNRQYEEATNTSISYALYRAYYGPPIVNSTSVQSTDFLRWTSIVDPANNWWFTSLRGTWEQLELMDPNRASSGQPFAMFAMPFNSSNIPRFEMWPHPLSERAYRAVWQRRGADLTSGEFLPPQIPDEMLSSRILVRTAMWAKMNVGTFPQLAKTNWSDVQKENKDNFKDLFNRASIADEEAVQQYWLLRDLPYPPLGLEWLINHDEILSGGGYM